MSRKNAARLAVLGLLLYSAGIVSAAVSYSFHHPAPYSPLNHFISELSSPALTPLAHLLSLCLAIGGLLQIPLFVQMAATLGSKTARAAMLFSLIAQAGVIGVGLAPMEFLTPHLICAFTFFGAWFLTALLFTIAIWKQTRFRKSPFILLAGLVACGVTGAFLTLTLFAFIFLHRHIDLQALCDKLLLHPDSFRRPAVWPIAILEWSILLSVYIWIAAAIHCLLSQPQSD